MRLIIDTSKSQILTLPGNETRQLRNEHVQPGIE